MICKASVTGSVFGDLRKTVAGLAVLIASVVGQQALAQQGDECLACHTGLPATENNLIAEVVVDEAPVSAACDYTNADLFDGWGWNPILSESCPPRSDADGIADDSAANEGTQGNCDYTNAAQFGGWGWDPVARQSCPPSENPSETTDDPHASFPVCSATLYDADGDGFGWENQASCIVTSASAQPPTFSNQSTGNTVDLVRAYWDGNTDIANKVIQCDLYYYDSYANQYQIEPVPFRAGASLNNQVFPSYQFRHLSLPPTAPFAGWVGEVSYVNGSTVTPTVFGSLPNWTTDDGRYIGPTVLQSPYVELVTLNDGARGIRTWHNSRFDTALDLQFSGNRVRNDGYFECRDTSGRDFIPTGTVGGGTSSPVVVSDLVFSTQPSPSQQELPVIQDPDTGATVELTKAYWNYNRDLAGRQSLCMTFVIGADGTDYPNGPVGNYAFPNHFTNSGNRVYYWDNGNVTRNSSFVIEDGVLQNPDGSDLYNNVIFASDYVQLVGDGVRFWRSASEFKWCQTIRPTGSAPEAVDHNQCDYTNASQFDGWGWNPATRQSCPPVVETPEPVATRSCDYTNAAASNGWGWNPILRESCPPESNDQGLSVMTDTNCDYSNAGAQNGWGWNKVTRQSCPPR